MLLNVIFVAQTDGTVKVGTNIAIKSQWHHITHKIKMKNRHKRMVTYCFTAQKELLIFTAVSFTS